MKIGWLQDQSEYTGGAELSGDALFNAAPDWADVVYCPAGKRPPADIEAWVIQNCATYGARWIEPLSTGPVIKSVRDYWPYGNARLRRWILDRVVLLLFSSRLHRDNFLFLTDAEAEMVPAPVDVEPFQLAALEPRERHGNVWLGRMWHGKGIGRALDWAVKQGEVLDFYGFGPDAATIKPPGRYRGKIKPGDVPQILAGYERFVFLPDWIEPFGRSVVEAYYAGCELEIDESQIGAWEWMQYEPEALKDPAGMFWSIVGEYLK